MGQTRETIEQVEQKAEETAREAAGNPWVERLGRLGYAAKGAVYLTVGLLALQAALGRGGATTDTTGALQAIGAQPLGAAMLLIIGIGFLGYALWRVLEAVIDLQNKGSEPAALLQRAGTALRGLLYAGLALVALQLLRGASAGDGNTEESWAARLLTWPFGAWLLGIGALVLMGAGVSEAYEAYRGKFRDRLALHEMSQTEQSWATRLGRLGLAARALVFFMMGLLLLQAARTSDASEAGGIGEALQTLAQQPYGPWLLALAALGLVAYGLFMLVHAKYLKGTESAAK